MAEPTAPGASPSHYAATASGNDNNDDDDEDDRLFLDKVLEVAVDAAKKAGDIIMGNAGGAEVTERKANSRDLLTLIDPLCEKTIYETIRASFATHDFLGEEDVAPGKEASAAALEAKLLHAVARTTTVQDNDDNDSSSSSSSSSTNKMSKTDGWLWVVDPIDGTTNFVQGLPICGPSIAATYQGQVMVAVIYDCHANELYTAIRGRGAYRNGQQRIYVNQNQTVLSDAVVAMGSPPGEESMQMSLRGVAVLMPKVRTIRMLGSAAIMLAWVACGRLTCYWEYDLSSWDIAAGALLITEAGGRFTDLNGKDYTLRTRKMCGSNGYIHDEILKILRDEAGIV
jgi:myo-inositol-1(or 4)-monophosphatase